MDENKLDKYHRNKQHIGPKKINKLHPLVSCVLYLDADESNAPTLVTTQTLHCKAQQLDSIQGYLCEAKTNRQVHLYPLVYLIYLTHPT